MQNIHMTDKLWSHLLSVRNGLESYAPACSDPAFDDPALTLYCPIASARSRFILAQVGQSLDGRVATLSGDARDISGPGGIAHLHRCRALVDAVIVGVGTVVNDDPRLSVRKVEGPSPVRVVIDCNGQLTGDESLFHDHGATVIIIQSDDVPERPYPSTVVRLPRNAQGLDVERIVDALEERGLNRILVEGGARTIARFIDAGLVDHLHVAIAPLIIGSGPAGISLAPVSRLCNAHRPIARVYGLGSDVLFDCMLKQDTRHSGCKGEDIDMPNSAEASTLAHV